MISTMSNPAKYLLLLASILGAQDTLAHGSVVDDEDICQLEIGFLKAHFKIYLPRTHDREEFCEDLPETTESLFVMEYEHDKLSTMPIDFRIIRDVTGLKSFVREEHVATIDDLEAVTVFYHPPAIESDVFSVIHRFTEPGWYVGIVTASSDNEQYAAVFPFEVGFTGIGYWVYFMVAIFLLLLFFWYERDRSLKGDRSID